MRVAITGANGRLGRELRKLDWPADVRLLPWTREDADLSKEEPTVALVTRERPDVVLHTASATDLVRCEKDRQYGWENVALPALHVARGCIATGARMVHVSTDYVFSGNEPEHPIPTWMRPDPTHYYATCKVAAEVAARAVPRHLVLRTTMKAREPWRHEAAPADMWISHAYYDEVAAFLQRATLEGREGIVHFGARDVNVFEFAKEGRPDVRKVLRSEIKSLALPGDIRLKVE